MKELSIEEKAKAYDEAIKVLHKYDGANIMFSQSLKEEMFPELKDSEDERIRKEISTYLKSVVANKGYGDSIIESWIAWLEKQGEQTPADKIEPKFKVKYAGGEYNVLEVKDIAGVTYYGIEDEPNHIDYVQAENCERVGRYSIKENGSPFPTKPIMFSEQKPVWSEEDDTFFKAIIRDIENTQYISEDAKKDRINWLKSLKNRVQPQQEWSEEDEHVLNTIINSLDRGRVERVWHTTIEEVVNWLKSLRPQNRWKPSDEQMEALHYVTNFDYGGHKATLVSLYEQLKKLKGE